MLLTGAAAAAVAGGPGPGHLPADLAAACLVPLALGGLGGALVSLLGGAASMSEGWSLAPPEAQGMRLAFRTAWPPAIAVIGAAPVLAARSALDSGKAAVDGALPIVAAVVVLFALITAWVRVRDDIAAWFRDSMAMAQEQQKERVRTAE
jgi:hypothetical protein